MNQSSSGNKPKLKKVDLEEKQVIAEFERTYNGWITTGIFALVGGLYVVKTLSKSPDLLVFKIFGISLILGSVCLFALAFGDYKNKTRNIKNKESKNIFSLKLAAIFCSILILSSAIGLILIFSF